MSEYLGKDGFIWFHGVVEDVLDPLALGRCRVRIFGYHSSNKQDIPTEELPWAHPIQPITDASISGVGNSPTGLVMGTHVVGFFRDGKDAQQPVIFGSIGGIPTEKANTELGFNDPSGVYPKETDEPDTHRLARGIKEETIVVSKEESRIEEVEIANNVNSDGEKTNKWSEPEVPYAAEYPLNQVYTTESGHVQEFDDTPEAERIHTYHKSGTFEEIHPDGSKVTKIIGDTYEIVVKDDDKETSSGNKNVHIQGNVNVTVEGNSTFFVKGNSDIEVDGDVTANIHKNLTATVDEDARINVKGLLTTNCDKTTFIKSQDGIFLRDQEGLVDFAISGGNCIGKLAGEFRIQADGNIYLNSGAGVQQPPNSVSRQNTISEPPVGGGVI